MAYFTTYMYYHHHHQIFKVQKLNFAMQKFKFKPERKHTEIVQTVRGNNTTMETIINGLIDDDNTAINERVANDGIVYFKQIPTIEQRQTLREQKQNKFKDVVNDAVQNNAREGFKFALKHRGTVRHNALIDVKNQILNDFKSNGVLSFTREHLNDILKFKNSTSVKDGITQIIEFMLLNREVTEHKHTRTYHYLKQNKLYSYDGGSFTALKKMRSCVTDSPFSVKRQTFKKQITVYLIN